MTAPTSPPRPADPTERAEHAGYLLHALCAAAVREPMRAHLPPKVVQWAAEELEEGPTVPRLAREVERLRGAIRKLEALVEELADDLESEVLDRWGGEYDDEGVPDTSGMHPAQRSRYERDMEIVHRSRAALSGARSEGEGS